MWWLHLTRRCCDISRDAQHLKEYNSAAEEARPDNQTYLDWAGAALYDPCALEQSIQALLHTANPHTSTETERRIDVVRESLKKAFGASEYELIFTPSASSGLAIVGEAFFASAPHGLYVYALESHTSVVGIRSYAWQNGGSCQTFALDDVMHGPDGCINVGEQHESSGPKLVALPMESNFDGKRFDPAALQRFKEHGFFVLLDGVKLPSRHSLDSIAADFVPVSFYKSFGFPTGVGGLFVRKTAASCLMPSQRQAGTSARPFFGGTVDAYSPMDDFFVPKASLRFFERGTVNFQGIIMLDTSLRSFCDAGISPAHAESVAREMYIHLHRLLHDTGNHVIEVLGNHAYGDRTTQGPTLAVFVKDQMNKVIPYSHVVRMASKANISLRGGCFCNVGACMLAFKLTSNDLRHFYDSGHVCSDDVCEINGKPTGAVRISFGRLSVLREVRSFLDFLKSTVLNTTWDPGTVKMAQSTNVADSTVPNQFGGLWHCGQIKHVVVYPVKGAGGIEVMGPCPFSSYGMHLDRRWAIMRKLTDRLVTVNLKSCPDFSTCSVKCDERGLFLCSAAKSWFLGAEEKVQLAKSADIPPQAASFDEWARESLGIVGATLEDGKTNVPGSILCVSLASHRELEETAIGKLTQLCSLL
eukprot:GEMP01016287.1.p1 GENE.GEMP01016287.1~~GEMP01016287.1.p1  ORF type:complete len:643 (-),score=112.16 GEMP01016287.1:907-2835(-)